MIDAAVSIERAAALSSKAYRIPLVRPDLPPLEAYVQRLEQIWKSRMLSNFGPNAQELQELLREATGVEHARVVASGDIGLMAVLRGLELPEGGEVIVPSFTFNSTANAVLWAGLRPVFADIDPGTFNLAPGSVQACLSRKTAAILATHVFGCPADADALQRVADGAGIPLIFDAAHGLGAFYKGRRVGSLGTAEVFSLSGTKVVTSAEGGLITTHDKDLAGRVDYIRQYGFKDDYISHRLGLNGKISELNAALGCLTIQGLTEAIISRHKAAARYRRLLRRADVVEFQQIPEHSSSALKDMAILLPPGVRDKVAKVLLEEGIQTKQYFRPLHRSPFFQRCRRGSLAVTEEVSERVLCLPMWNKMGPGLVDIVAGQLLLALNEEGAA